MFGWQMIGMAQGCMDATMHFIMETEQFEDFRVCVAMTTCICSHDNRYICSHDNRYM